MAKTPEEEINELKEKNNLLVQTVQQWKMIAAQREEEKIELMKELNQMRMNMSHYRNASSDLDSVLESAVQEFGKNTLTKLVEVSNSITGTVEMMKSYIRKKQEVERMSPSKSTSLLESPKERSSNKVLRVVPMIRGRSIGKPYIVLRPIDAAAYGFRQDEDETNVQEEEVRTSPRHMLQEVYIPLHRIDAESVNVNRRTCRNLNVEIDRDRSDAQQDTEEYNTQERIENSEDETQIAETQAEVNETQTDEQLDRNTMETVFEETEDENWSPQVVTRKPPSSDNRKSNSLRDSVENPLEGPSWLLDRIYKNSPSPVISKPVKKKSDKVDSSEPDSTTDGSQAGPNVASVTTSPPIHSQESPLAAAHTPTRRARRRLSHSRVSLALIDDFWSQPDLEPHHERDLPSSHKDPTKALVMVAKMKMEDLSRNSHINLTPQRKFKAHLEAPSPNGSTQDAGPIVMDISNFLDTSEVEPVVESLGKLQLKNAKNPTLGGQRIGKKRPSCSEKSKERRDSIDESSIEDRTFKPTKMNRDSKARSSRKISHSGSSTQGKVSQGRATEEFRSRLTGAEERSSDSESDTGSLGGRSKRPRRMPQSYKEKPLNRKLRRQD